MPTSKKNIVRGLIALLIVMHVGALFLFFGPLGPVLRFSGLESSTFVPMAKMPLELQQAFHFVPAPEQLTLPEPESGWQGLNQELLKLRYHRIMDEAQKRAVILNSLSFGEGVFGLQAGALHYFQKPLDQLNAQEAVHLAAFYQVFQN